MRNRRFWIWAAAAAAVVVVALVVAGVILSRRFEPYIRERTVAYLERRFDSKAEFQRLQVSMPVGSPLQVLLNKGRGAIVRVTGHGLSLRHKGRTDVPPMFQIHRFHFEVELNTLWEQPAIVRTVRLDGLQLAIPPKGERPSLRAAKAAASNPPEALPEQPAAGETDTPQGTPPVVIREIVADGARLSMVPKDPAKEPLVFDIMKLKLTGAGPNAGMRFDAVVHNAKPPGLVISHGNFGPWAAAVPSHTPLRGDYTFHDADLGVFKGIAGKLNSQGSYRGLLGGFIVDGVTDTPDFRLAMSGNPVPLKTQFHAIVDGANGNTLLQPVIATLGSTVFRCNGGVVRGPESKGKSVLLDVVMQKGRIDDVLRLAMKGPKPFLRGGVGLNMQFELPPGLGEIADRLLVSGKFNLRNAHFTAPTVQDKIDEFSRRGQGRPKDEQIDEVPSNLAGAFHLANGVIRFSSLRFAIPGAEVDLKGRYKFGDESLAFRGSVRLDAKVSQTQSGWKRIVLKPVDPFFSKKGAGTFLNIQISGTSEKPEFGRDKGISID